MTLRHSLTGALIATVSTLGLSVGAAQAEAVKYIFDASHSQIVFTYNHVGFSTSAGMYSGFEGEIMFDEDAPENSSVTVTFPAGSMITGWDARSQHVLQSGDFLKLDENPEVRFVSTGIEVTGEDTANITGDLTLNGVTKSVVLDATLNKKAPYPFGPNQGKAAAGFDATTTLARSDYGLGAFAPAVGDDVRLQISIEAVAE